MKKRGSVFEPVLQRSRLLASLQDVYGVVAVEAPVGFGKTILLRQIVREADGILLAEQQSYAELASRLDAEAVDSMLVAVDSATDRVDDVMRLVEHPAVGVLVVADRYLAPEILELEKDYDYRHLTERDLRLTEEEVHQLAELIAPMSSSHPPKDGPPDLAARVAYILSPASEGWPLASAWMLRRAFTSGDPLTAATEMCFPGPDADRFVDEHLGRLEPHLRDAIEALAHFDAFTGSCLDTLVGQDGVSLARRAGAPLLVGERSWLRLPHPITRPLQSRGDLDASTAELLAPVLIASGGVLAGIRALMQAGCIDGARRSLEGLTRVRFGEVDQQGLIDLVATFRGIDDTPQLALIEARGHRRLGNHPASDRCLEECLEMGADGWVSDPANAEVILEARIDRLFGIAFTPSAAVDAEIAELRAQIREDMSPILALRLNEIDALLRAQLPDPAAVHQASNEVLAIAKRWENLGHMQSSVTAIRKICSTGLAHLGRYLEAIAVLEHAHELAWHMLRERTLTLSLTCRFRVLAGEVDTVAGSIAELDSLSHAIGQSWIKGYVRWTQAILASRRGDPVRVVTYLGEAEDAMGPLLEHETGVLFRSEAATVLAEVGLLDEAEAQLGLVADRASYDDVDYAIASIAVAARRGRREDALAVLTELEESGRLPRGRAWRPTFEASIAADLDGDAESATRLRSTALAEAERYGHGRLAARLLQTAPSLGVPAEPASTLRIKVLGPFAVEFDGNAVEVPDGHVKVLLKLLAVRDGAVPTDVVFEALWPEAEPGLARRRMKNIVSRLRSLVGSDHVIRTQETIALAPQVDVDLRRFNDHVRSALAADGDDRTRLGHLTAALDLYEGPVLPTDLYEDWAVTIRDATVARTLTLLDRVFDVEDGRRPAAAWLLDVLLRVDPNDDTRLLRVTRQALAEGHEACARAALERALAVAQELGVSLDDEVRDLRFLLKTA